MGSHHENGLRTPSTFLCLCIGLLLTSSIIPGPQGNDARATDDWIGLVGAGSSEKNVPLSTDQGLEFSTLLESVAASDDFEMDVDPSGCIYISGETPNPSFTTTTGSFCGTYNGGSHDLFALKVSQDGTELLYSTFIGGSADDQIGGLCVDSEGHAHIAGYTSSPDFPTTPDAFCATLHGGDNDGFVLELNVDGSGLVHSTLIGGSGADQVHTIRVDGTGSKYIAGRTNSSDFPTTSGTFDETYNGEVDAFVTKLTPDGADLSFSTFLGSENWDDARDMELDAEGCPHVVGATMGALFPTTAGAFDTTGDINGDLFVTKLGSGGSSLDYSTYLGGSSTERDAHIGIDASGFAYIGGVTQSRDLPTTYDAYNPFDYRYDHYINIGFLSKVNRDGTALIFSTYYGKVPDSDPVPYLSFESMYVDRWGAQLLPGSCIASDVPTTEGGYDSPVHGSAAGFLSMMDPTGSYLSYCAHIGGSKTQVCTAAHGDDQGHAFIIGYTSSADFPTTPGAYCSTFGGALGLFALRLSLNETDDRPRSPVENLTAIEGNGNVTLVWDPSLEQTHRLLHTCRVLKTGPDGSLALVYERNGPNYRLWDGMVTNGQTCTYEVRVVSFFGTGPGTRVEAMPWDYPGVPGSLRATPASSSVFIEWSPPIYTGGPAIEGYRIFRAEDGSALEHLADAGNVTRYVDIGLINGFSYRYAVKAFHARAESDLSEVVTATPIGPPYAPRNLTAARGDGKVLLAWDPPITSGGRAITCYRVYRGPSREALVLYDLVLNVTGYTDFKVTNGVTYFYALSAESVLGEGSIGEVVWSRPAGPPGPPLRTVAVEGIGNVSLSWDAPLSTNGAPLLEYRVYRGISPTDLMLVATVENATHLLDQKVVNGVTYCYQVACRNDAGESVPGELLSARPMGIPSEPFDLTAGAGVGRIVLLWISPPETGGSAIVSWRIYRGVANGTMALRDTIAASAETYIDLEVVGGIAYQYMVSAVNDRHEGLPSDTVTVVPWGAPSAPSNLTVRAGDGNATLTWSAPGNLGGKPILGYRVYRTSSGPTSQETLVASYIRDLTYTVHGLTNGREVKFTVRAENEVGIGPGVEASVTPLGLPSSPTNLFADPLEAAIKLSWSRPLDDGGSRIIGYIVWRGSSRTDLRPLATIGNLTSYIDGDVKAGEVYYYSVQASNAIGNGSSPDPIEARLPSGGLTGLGVGGSLVIVLLIAAVSIIVIAWYIRRTRVRKDIP